MKEIDLIVEIELPIKMTTEVTMERTIEMVIEKKIIGISKTRDIRENIKIIMKTYMTRIIIELATKTGIEAKIRDQNKDQYRDDSYDKTRSRSKEKDYLYDDDDIFHSEIKECTKFYK